MTLLDQTLKLRPGTVVVDHLTRSRYRVQNYLGAGGFGAAYNVHRKAARYTSSANEYCLKITWDPDSWHRESYFGQLMKGVDGVLGVFASFAWVPSTRSKPLYCLVTELASGGDLTSWLVEHPKPWPEKTARKEILRLLGVVRRLHWSGAVHRDITPANVFVTARQTLKLGDFGIAFHRLGKRYVIADVFAPYFKPKGLPTTGMAEWKPSDDVFHLGQLLGMLIAGRPDRLKTKDVKSFRCSPEIKAVIQRCIGPRRKRYADAEAMVNALRKQEQHHRSKTVTSFDGKRVVFTGALSLPRKNAVMLLRKAGGFPQRGICHNTDIIVVGKSSPHFKAGTKGQKLLDLAREFELGHNVAVIGEKKFLVLVAGAA